jgi:hypothetical protein
MDSVSLHLREPLIMKFWKVWQARNRGCLIGKWELLDELLRFFLLVSGELFKSTSARASSITGELPCLQSKLAWCVTPPRESRSNPRSMQLVKCKVKVVNSQFPNTGIKHEILSICTCGISRRGHKKPDFFYYYY